MKNFILIIALCLFSGISLAATVSGTVTNGSTSTPMSGVKVFVEDSLLSYTDSAVTNGSGAYSVTLPGTVSAGHPITVSVTACGALSRQFYVFSGANIVSNFTVCSGSGVTLHGTVSLGSASNNGLARLYLIRKGYDTAIKDTVLTLVDSITTAATGGTYSKTFASTPSGTLLLKAALLPSHPLYGAYLPTYYSGALIWSNAAPLSGTNFIAANATNINMVAGINPGGPAFVNGSVLLGANKAQGVGDPLPDRILILTTSAGQAVKHTFSDSRGKFSFTGLNYGTYKMFGDAWGKGNPTLTFTLTANNNGAQYIVFEENDTVFRGRLTVATSISSKGISQWKVYPNPATNELNITGVELKATLVYTEIVDVQGRVRQQAAFSAANPITIDLRHLAAGMYYLRLKTEEESAVVPFVRQ